MHDYFSGMRSERNDGAAIAEITGMRKNRKAKEFGRQPQRFMRCGCLFVDKSSEKETKHRLKNFAAIWSLICPHTRSILSLL